MWMFGLSILGIEVSFSLLGLNSLSITVFNPIPWSVLAVHHAT
jgi:hypothetical protein